MPDPIIFTSVTPHYSLPLLFPGQVQKEFYVNEALSLLDSLIHSSVEGMATTPPLSPSEGDLWLIAAPSQDSWRGSNIILLHTKAMRGVSSNQSRVCGFLTRSRGNSGCLTRNGQQAAFPVSPKEARISIQKRVLLSRNWFKY